MTICCCEGATRCLVFRGFCICLGSSVDDVVVRIPKDWDSIIESLNPIVFSDLNPSDPSWCGGGNFSLLLVVFALSLNLNFWYSKLKHLKVKHSKTTHNLLEAYIYVDLQLCICFWSWNRPAWSNAGVCFLLHIAIVIAISAFANNIALPVKRRHKY